MNNKINVLFVFGIGLMALLLTQPAEAGLDEKWLICDYLNLSDIQCDLWWQSANNESDIGDYVILCEDNWEHFIHNLTWNITDTVGDDFNEGLYWNKTKSSSEQNKSFLTLLNKYKLTNDSEVKAWLEEDYKELIEKHNSQDNKIADIENTDFNGSWMMMIVFNILMTLGIGGFIGWEIIKARREEEQYEK